MELVCKKGCVIMNEIQKEMVKNIDWTDINQEWSLYKFLLDQPLSANQINNMIYYIVNEIRKKEIMICKLKEKDKHIDTSQYEYEIDYAKSILGLNDKPCVSDYKFYQEIKKQKGGVKHEIL